MKTLIAVSALALLFSTAPVHAQTINDAQIASIVVTANQVDIDAGKLARASAIHAPTPTPGSTCACWTAK